MEGDRRPNPPPAAPSKEPPHPVTVRIVHGSLECAAEPVAVGHYQGMPIAGAEGALDQRLEGRLSDRLVLGAYAEQEGTAVLVPSPMATPPGGIVLGLGTAGEVSASKISRAMTKAVQLRVLAAVEIEWVADDAGGAPAPKVVGIATVLVGASPLEGMAIAGSLAALVEGVVAAVQVLKGVPRLWERVRIGHLEIIELYSDRAKAAHHALAAIAQQHSSTEVELRPDPELGGGTEADGAVQGQPALDYKNSSQTWSRLDIRSIAMPPPRAWGIAAPQDPQQVTDPVPDPPRDHRCLEFTSIARRARADRLQQVVEVPLVDDLIAQAVSQPATDAQVCNTLYELLVPSELKYDLANADNLHLLLDAGTAGYPWEALAPRPPGDGKGKAPGSRSGILRQFAEPASRSARFNVRRASGRHVLVIGNPPAGDNLSKLDGAAAEAAKVATFLTTGHPSDEEVPPETPDDPAVHHEVHSLIWGRQGAEASKIPQPNGASWFHIVNALFRHEYRIIHIAAHGMFNADNPSESGIVIGPNRFLTAQTFGQLPVVPELVFLNCCHSGVMSNLSQTNLLAASVARELMGIGVRAVVAAGWAVDDEAAPAFAERFYLKMLKEGCGFGEAVRDARQTVRVAFPKTLTWAAYQCYGDPEFRLRGSPA